jgi:preprotein translocase subunit SecG
MSTFFFLLGILAMLVSVVLIFAVIIQNSKGGGLSSSFGGASSAAQVLGSRRSNEFIEKFTWYLFAGLVALAFFSNVVGTNMANSDGTQLLMEESLNASDAYIEGGIDQVPTYNTPPEPQEGAEGSGN